ncbi:MAG: recombinase family protein [Oscillospiraceae bacterium]|nr:recombinase family protein [Oscillospiraceae bacterium]
MYLRKSRQDNEAEARGEGETLARHKKALFALAHLQKLRVGEVYEEVVSGETIAARPEMQRLLRDVETGKWAGVLVMEVERLARGDTSDQGAVAKTFQYSDTKIVTPMKTFDPRDEFDEEYFEYSLFMSRREYKTINRRMQRGRAASINEGKYVANQPPYGYVRVKLEKQKGWTLEEHPQQAEVVRAIFDLYTHGELQEDGSYKRLGAGLIVKWLNRMDIPAKKGGVWVAASVRDILINPVYIGKVRWNFRPAVKKMTGGEIKIERPRSKTGDCVIVDGLHKGIVDEGIFTTAQEFMKHSPARPVGERGVVKNPLSGIVYCGMCGRSMVRRAYPNNNCADTLMCVIPTCKNVSVKLSSVEERLLEALETWLGGHKLKLGPDSGKKKADKSKTQIELKRKALDKIESEIETLKKQRSKAHDLLEQGVYDTDTFLDRTKEIGERIQKAEDKRNAAQTEVREESRAGIIPRVEKLFDVYWSLQSPAAKNDLLKDIVEKVTYIKEKSGRWHNSPDNFELTVYPKLPMYERSQ